MGYQRERDEFFAMMAREGVPTHVVRIVLRHAATLQRLAVEECNRPLRPTEYTTIERCRARIRNALREFGVTPLFQDDPRGAVVKLRVPSGKTNDWGQEGICVPTRG